METKLARN